MKIRVLQFVFAVFSGLIFFHAWILASAAKPLTGDEVYGIEHSVAPSIATLLVHGADGQGSPSPLYYIAVKPLVTFRWPSHEIKAVLAYRFLSAFAIFASALCLAYGMRTRWAPGLDSLALFLFMFSKQASYFAAEARPYTLWLAAVVLICVSLHQDFKQKIWSFVYPIMAMTATAIIFQITAVIISLGLSKIIGRTTDLRRSILPLSLGVFVAGYYSLHAGKSGYWGPEWGTWSDFYTFVHGYRWVFLGNLVLLGYSIVKVHGESVASNVTFCLWFLMSPGIFWLTRHQGFFFNSRQYIYWTVTTVIIAVDLIDILIRRAQSKLKLPYRFAETVLLILLSFQCINRLDINWALSNYNHALGSPFTLRK